MKAKNCLIFGGSGQIGRHLIRKLTKNNYKVTVVTRNLHQKSYIIKTQANAGYIDIVEANIFEEEKIKNLFKKADIVISLIGILYEKGKASTFENIHSVFPSLLAKLCKEYKIQQFIHLSALGIQEAIDSEELYGRTFVEYHNTCDRPVNEFGKNKIVLSLRSMVFLLWAIGLPDKWGPVRLGNEISKVRGIF